MSANIKVVERKCLNDIINWLSYKERFWKDTTKGECTKLFEELGYNLSTDNGRNRLFQDMINLNIEAVESSYTDDELVKGVCISMINDSKDYSFEYSSVNAGIFQALKSIRCWLSKCTEGEPMESSMLYVTFETIEDIIMTSLVEQIPEYQEACRY